MVQFGGSISCTATDSISLSSENGNIDIATLGKFQLVDENNNITANGYNNIGTCGNINIRSTFGNIGINTVQNKLLADFEKQYVCAPWNPSFLKQLALITQFIPALDEQMVLSDISPFASNIISWIVSLQTVNVLFDGFPTFLPCKMIMQNPNIGTPKKSKSQWIKDFRTIDINWNSVLNNTYWKMISKVIGNIDISSWSGDISIKTAGTLGNAGNINIFANNKYGALPGYQCGNINMTANTPFTIYTDPRDLFFDSHLKSRFTGKYYMFSSINSSDNPFFDFPINTVKPFQTLQMLANLIGVPAEFGFSGMDSGGGGCIKCIVDVLHSAIKSVGGFSLLPFDICIQPFIPQSTNPTHKFNTLNNSLVQPKQCDSSSLMLKTSNGFGHAVDDYGLGETFQNFQYKMGGIFLNGVGSSSQHFGKNYKVYADENNFKFGVKNKVNTGWVKPSLDMSPLMPWPGIMLPIANNVPIIKNNILTHEHTVNDRDMGSYMCKNVSITRSGIYPLAAVKSLCVGINIETLSLNIPWINIALADLQFSFKPKNIITQPYQIPYTCNVNVPFQKTVITNNWFENTFKKLITVKNVFTIFNKFADKTITYTADQVLNDDINSVVNYMTPLVVNIANGGTVSPQLLMCGEAIGTLAGFDKGRNALTTAVQNLKFPQNYDGQQFSPTTDIDVSGNEKSKFNFTIGNPQRGFGIKFVNQMSYKEFQQDMPNFSAAAPTLANAAELLKPFFPGVGDMVKQLIKGLPQVKIKDKHFLQLSVNPIAGITGETAFAADLFLSTSVTAGGIVIPKGNPLLNGSIMFGIPNIAKLIDPLFAAGTSVSLDPIMIAQTLLKILSMVNDGPKKLLEDVKCAGKIGIGAPGFLADIFGTPDIGYVSAGMDNPVTPFIKVSVLQPLKALSALFAVCLQPPSLSINPAGILTLDPLSIVNVNLSDKAPAITGDVHVFGTGIRLEGKLTASNVSIETDIDVLKDIIQDSYVGNIHSTFAGSGPNLNITAPTIQSTINIGKMKGKQPAFSLTIGLAKFILVILQKQIFNIFKGGAGLLR